MGVGDGDGRQDGAYEPGMATRTASAAPRVMCYVDGHQAHQVEPVELRGGLDRRAVELSGLGIIEDRTPKMSKSQMGRGIATAVLLFITVVNQQKWDRSGPEKIIVMKS